MLRNDISIAFFGTPDLTLPILDELESAGFLPKIIVTGEDERKGRHLELQEPAPKAWAKKREILVLQPGKLGKDFLEEFKKYDIDLGIVVAYGKILPQALLDIPKYGMINVHYSLLPKYRGATPVESAILNGDTETGVVIQKMVYELDAGDVIEEEKTAIRENETAPELRNRLNEVAKKMLIKAVERMLAETAITRAQNGAEATFTKRIKKEDGLIDPAGDAVENDGKFRAYYGWPGSYFFTEKNGKKIRVIIKDAKLENGIFEIKKVVPEGKKEMSYKDFLSGYKS